MPHTVIRRISWQKSLLQLILCQKDFICFHMCKNDSTTCKELCHHLEHEKATAAD
jgi:hypothetical protein